MKVEVVIMAEEQINWISKKNTSLVGKYHQRSMLSRRNRIALFTVFLLLSFTSADAISQEHFCKTGTVAGSIGRIDTREGFIPLPGLSIVLTGGKQTTIESNANGDYVVELPVGKYCVSSISDKHGQVFLIKDSQSKCFDIKKKKDTRFDMVVDQK
jgi:hypothetical protein